MLALGLMSPEDATRAVADRARARRVALGLTQVDVAARADVPSSTLRRFESTGKIGFAALVRIAFVLDAVEELGGLFPEPEFRSLDDVVSRPKRQRGLRKKRSDP